MKIVVLDGYCIGMEEKRWAGLKALGELTVYERTQPGQTAERMLGADIALTNKTKIGQAELSACPGLKYISVLATGYDVVDIEAAKQRGVPVSNVPAYSTASVAQLVFALLLEICHHTGEHAALVRGGEWSRCPDYHFRKYPLVELEGMTMGIIGTGAIGIATAKLARAFGMEVLAYSRTQKPGLEGVLTYAGLEDVLKGSDVVSLHVPMSQATAKLINKDTIAQMKDGAILINTSRGALIDEEALAKALSSGKLAFAGLDVLSTEPPKPDNPMIGVSNAIVTPHIAWATEAAIGRLISVSVKNIESYMAGKPQNVINGVF